MSDKPTAAGQICWVELMTASVDGAKEFYSALFGWEFADDPIPGGGSYTMASLGGKHVAGLFELNDELKSQGVPPNWMPYVKVPDAAAAAAKVTALGGTVVREPFDVMDVGRMAVFTDPSGATLSLWQGKGDGVGFSAGETGTFSWAELMTRDVDAAGKFFAELFDWKPQTSDMGPFKYTVFMIDDKNHAAGMLPMAGPQFEGVPPNWAVYFSVEDCDATAAKAEALGGKMKMPPQEVPGVGRFTAILDPHGATFAIIQPDAAHLEPRDK